MSTQASQSTVISVIVPAYNEQKYLPSCLASLQRQQCEVGMEILVVDNGSTDSTSLIAEQMGAKVVYEAIRGIAQARQTGLEAATGEILIYTDADNQVPAHWVQSLYKALLRDSGNVAATNRWGFYDSQFMNSIAGIWFDRVCPLIMDSKSKLNQGYLPLAAPGYAVRRRSLAEIGGFCTHLRTSDDADLSIRLSPKGTIVFLPQLLAFTSARRFRQNPLGTTLTWTVNHLGIALLKRVLLNYYPDYR